MKLWAISDLHVGFAENRRAVETLDAMPEDWLILAGDTGESPAHLEFVLRTLTPRFGQIIWAPGNHDLWTPRAWPAAKRGDTHYRHLVRLCQRHGALTPEDPYVIWPGEPPRKRGGTECALRTVIAPTFLLYDYSFGPSGMSAEEAVSWAAAGGLRCADEDLLSPDPYRSRAAWCRARLAEAAARLDAIPPGTRIVLVNHFPLRREHAILPRIPRFAVWCGTRATEDWHRRYPIDIVVSGHLHVRRTTWLDDVRFEEVSLGYPRQWDVAQGLKPQLRQIL